MTSRPLCFVLMPFGRKPGPSGSIIDFDAVYEDLIAAAIRDADLEPLRADQEITGGVIHKPMFERLILCDYAVADLTTANANVFYELGVRHALRPHSTVLLFGGEGRLPFDAGMARAIPYAIAKSGRPARIEDARAAIATQLRAVRDVAADSPVFQLVDGLKQPDVDHLKTDVFRDRARYSESVKDRLGAARALAREDRSRAASAIEEVRSGLKAPVHDVEAGVVIDLFLSYRALSDWQKMIDLYDDMSEPLQRTALVREQYGMALNRAGRSREAEKLLDALIEERGPSSESYGILGRVHKDRWDEARQAGRESEASGHLRRAVEAYLAGFESDWRDSYPGVNAVTLMEVSDPPDPRRFELLPVVLYAVERKIASGEPDYWDCATVIELAVLQRDEERARKALSDALSVVRERWEPETTARNLKLIREARQARGEQPDWAGEIESELDRRARGDSG